MSDKVNWDEFTPVGQPASAAKTPAVDWSQFEVAKPSGALRKAVGDKALGFASGAVGATKALADVAGAGNVASNTLEDVNKGINDYLSPEAKADQQEQSAIMSGAAGKGTWEGIKAGAKAFSVAPVQTAVQGLGSVVPIIAGTALTGGAAPAAAVGAGIGVAMGAGTVKGAIFDEVKKRGIAKGLTEDQAKAEAGKAQEYGGANTDQIALGGALGAADALTGVSAAASRMARGALRKPVADAAANTAERGVLARAGMGMLGEMPLEAAQGGQEQVAANLAAQRAGYEAGTWDNVASNATLEALASAGPGAAFGAPNTQTKKTPPPVVPPAPVQEPRIDPAIAATNESGAAPANGMGFNPDAGQMTQFPDGSQSFTSEVPPAEPVKPSEAMGLDPAAGPMSAAAVTAVDAGVTQEIQLADAAAADQAAYEQATQAEAEQAAKMDSIDKPITSGPIAEAAMSDEDKRAILFSNKTVADGGVQYEGTKDGDILNGMGKPYPTRFAAQRRARMEGKDWTIAAVFDGYVARRKDAIEQNTAQGTNPTAVEAPGEAPQAVASATTPTPELPAEGSGTVEGVGVERAPFMRPEDKLRNRIDSTAQELAMQIHDSSEDADFDPKEIPQAIQQWAKDSNVPADELRIAVKAEIEARKFRRKAGVLQAINPLNQAPAQAEQAQVATKGVAPAQVAQVDDVQDVQPNSTPAASTKSAPIGKNDWTRVGSKTRPFNSASSDLSHLIKNFPEFEWRVAQTDSGYAVERKPKTAAPDTSTGAPAVPITQPAQPFMGEGVGSSQSTQIAAAKPKTASKADLDHLFGLDQKRPKAIERIAKGTAYFSKPLKAQEFITKNGLKETHKAVKTSATRWDIVSKNSQPQESTNGTQTPQAVEAAQERQEAPAASVDQGDGINDNIRALRAKSFKSVKQGGPMGDVRLSTSGEYVSFDDAVAEARKAVASGVRAVPFQIHNALDVNIGEADRIIAALSAPVAKPITPQLPPAAQDDSQWSRIRLVDREAIIAKTDLKPIVKKNIVNKAWSDLNGDIQKKLTKAMEPAAAAENLPEKQKYEGSHMAAGRADFATGKPRVLPSYFTKPGDKNSKDWYRGWDAANAGAPVSDMQTADKQELPPPTKAMEPTAAPAKDNGQDDWTTIGRNQNGKLIVADKLGVRSYVENGIRVTEAVTMRPARNGMQLSTEHKGEFLSVDEIAKDKQSEEDDGFLTKAEIERINKSINDPETIKQVMGGIQKQVDAQAPTKPDALSDKEKAAKAKMFNALGKLAALAGKNTRMNWTPEEEQQLLPIVIELFDGAMEMGSVTFQKAVRYVREFISSNLDKETADAIPFETLQGAYIHTARKFKDQGATSGKEVMAFDSLAELEKSEDQADTGAKETNDATRPLDSTGQSPLEGAPANPVQGTSSVGPAAASADGRGQPDAEGTGNTDGAGVQVRGGMGDAAGGLPVSTGRGRGKRGSAKQPGVSGNASVPQGNGSIDTSGGTGGLIPANQAPNAAPIAAPAFDPQDFTIEDDFALGEGGAKAKFKGNVAAIRLVAQLDSEGRSATPTEQRVLAAYVGWGGLAQAFDENNADWSKEYTELKGLMSEDDYAAARASTRYAHYTSREIIQDGIYAALKHMGFNGGRALEGGAGVGNFIGLMPADMRSASRFTAIEREPFSAKIARNLYPLQNIQEADFTEFVGNDDFYDVAVGNPPFASDPQVDRSGRKHLSGLTLHNYFFAKEVDMLREGGILAQVVTNAFMDANTDTARQYISEKTKFLGAIRLPNNAFSKNAGTEVTTDLIFLQKRPESEWGGKAAKADAKQWLGVGQITDAEGRRVALNQYFIDKPEMMLGKFGAYGTMYRGETPALLQKPGQDTAALLKEAVAKLPANVYTDRAIAATAAVQDSLIKTLSKPSVQEGGYFEEGGKLFQRIKDIAGEARGKEITPETMWTAKTKLGDAGFARIKSLSAMRETVRSLLAAELSNDPKMVALRKTLNIQYDAYDKEHGRINDVATLRVFDDDPDFPLLASLEHGYTPAIGMAAAKSIGIKMVPSKATKGPIFTQRVIDARQQVAKVETPSDALAVSMAERGKLDSAYIGELLGRDADEVLQELANGDKPLLFKDPANGEYALRDAYLSGNVRAKLVQAKQAGMFNNIKALEEVQPEDVGSHEINARIGSPWVPESVYQDFAKTLFGDGTTSSIKYIKETAGYGAYIKAGSSTANTNTWGTPDYPGSDILSALLNNKPIKVTYKDADGTLRTDTDATEKANIKAQEIRNKFQDWLFADGDRAEILGRAYNDTNNNYVTREFDGEWMTFPGKVPNDIVKFRRHQRNAIARIVQDRTALLDHVVGSGKTYTIIAAAMELRRTGLARKPMIAVPNHLVKQWASDFYKLYPGANILTATKKDFEKSNRRKFLAKIATGDWDAVIIAHSSYGFIKPAPDFEHKFNSEQVANIIKAIKEVEAGDGDKMQKKRTVKQLEGIKERLENRIKALRDKPMDALLDFGELGVDQLFVDEAHMFKNLMFTTKMQNIAGLGDSMGSQRAYDMYVKANQIYSQNGRGQGVVFATGTPVSNSLAEMYHMMRYLMPAQMKEMGFESFDAWANTYAAVEQVWMQKASGDGFKAQNRMSNFVNTPELLKVFDQVSDTVTMDDIKKAFAEENGGAEFPLPKLKNGKRTPVSLTKSAAQNTYMDAIAQRALAVEQRKGPPEKGQDNILVIMSDARKAAMDIRLVDPTVTEREPGGRIDRSAGEIFDRYQQYGAVKGTQIVFSDLGTPLKAAKKELAEYQALMARIEDGAADGLMQRASMGDESAQEKIDDAEDAQEELDAKGKDWLGAVQAAERGFSVYDDLKLALTERGIPENEIAFIHDYNTDEQKAGLFRKMNSGQIRVLVGSTPKLGAGTNVQERLVALHHLDVPWKPSDVEQREGRIIRQGNKLDKLILGFEVEVLAYVTQDTLDMRMWQVQETKLKMINQLRTRKIDRDIENAFEDLELSAGEMQAAATGNMDLLREIQIKADVKKLEQRKRAFDAQKSDLQNRKKSNAQKLDTLPGKIESSKPMADASDKYKAELAGLDAAFTATIDGKEYTDAKEAGALLLGMVDAHVYMQRQADGKYGGRQLTLEATKNEPQQDPKAADFNPWVKRPVPLNVNVNGVQYTSREKLLEAFADLRGDKEPIAWNLDGKTLNRRSVIEGVIRQSVAAAIADEQSKDIGKLGPFTVSVEGFSSRNEKVIDVALTAGGQTISNSRGLGIADENTAQNSVKAIISMAENLAISARQQHEYEKRQLQQALKERADLDSAEVAGEWPDQSKLEDMRKKYQAVLKRLSGAAQAKKDAELLPLKPERMEPLNGAVFSAGNSAPETQLPLAQIERLVKSALRGVRNPPVIRIVANPEAIGLRAPVDTVPSGVVLANGDIYVFQSGIGTALDVDMVVFHELFHKGLQNVMPAADYVAAMQGIAKADSKVREYSSKWSSTNAGKAALTELAKKYSGKDLTDQYEALAIEEGLAMVAEDLKAKRQMGTKDMRVRRLAAWLAKMADMLGMTRLADKIRAMSYTAAEKFVVDTISKAGGRGPGGGNKFSSKDADPEMRFRSLDSTLNSAANSVRDVKLPAGYLVSDLISGAPGKLGWWHKTVGTQYNLAQRSKPFKRVYDAVQTFMNDVSHFATEAADLAPNILPKLETWRDIGKSPLSAADTKALSAPVFEGTLNWARDESGKAVKMDVLEAAAAKLTPDQKAQRLLRGNHLSQQVLKMWQGMKVEQYESMVNAKYERDMLKAGIVFTDAELRQHFNLTSSQIALYREFRAATDKSLTSLAIADMLRFGGDDVAPIRDTVQGAKTVNEAAETLRDYLLSLAEADPERNDVLTDTANRMIEKGDKAQGLIDRGYAPLSRFGHYTLDVVDENGERVYFSLFESKMEAAKMRRKMEGLYPSAQITQGTVSEEAYKMFAGVSPETLELFGDMLGLEAQGDSASAQAFQEYLKLAKSNRSAMKRLIQRQGIAGFSEDAGRVLAGFVYSNARQAASSLHMGEMTQAANEIPKTQGELKDAAVKLVDYIKNPQEEAQALRGLLFAQYIGGSVASAMVNMTQPLTMTFPWLSQYGGVTKAAKQMTAAVVDSNKRKTGDARLDAALLKAEEDGTVSPQEVHQLMQQSMGKATLRSGDGTRAGNAIATAQNGLSRVSLAWGKLFGAAEQFNRRVTFIAAYRTAVAEKMGDPEAFARKAIMETQGVYNKGNKPQWARGAIGATLFTFKQYSISYVEMLTRMAKSGPEGKKAALLALGVLFLTAGAGGLPGADDLDDIISGAMQAMGYNFDSKQKRQEFFVSLFGEGGAQFMERGVSGLPGVPVDLSGRMGLGNLIPATGLLTKKPDHSRDLAEIAGPAGDLIKRAYDATGKLLTGDIGGKNGAIATIAPKAAQNLYQAYDMAKMGMYRDAKGMKVLDTDAGDAMVKALGFQPTDVALRQDASFDVQRMIGVNRMRETEIANAWALGIFEKDSEKVQAARENLREWNETNPESPIRINFRQIQQRVKNMNQTKAERIARTAPKEIRADVRRELDLR